MSRDSAKAHYAKQPGDPDEGFITASDAQAAIDDIYDDMSAPAVIADGSVTSGKIAADAVGSAQIATGAVGSGELATDAVTSDKIADGAVSNAHVASDAAIAASKVAGTAVTQADTGTVTNGMLAGSIAKTKVAGTAITAADTGTVTGTMIAAGAVDNGNLAANAVNEAKIASGAVTTVKIADDAVTSDKIADNAVTAAQIAANAVGASELADNAVDTAAIAADAVTADKIANDTITAAELAANSVGTSELANDSVTAAKILDGTITANEIQNASITGAKLVNDTITATQIADNAVDTNAIANDAVTAAKIAADAVGSSEIAAGAVGTAEIADAAVTSAKIADGTIVSGDVAADTFAAHATVGNLLTANQASVETDSSPFGAFLNCTISRSTDHAAHGSACLKAIATAEGQVIAGLGITTVPVTPGETITGTFALKADRNLTAVRITIQWGTGGAAGAVVYRLVNATTAWVTHSLTVVVPAGVDTAGLFAWVTSEAPAGSEIYMDCFGIWKGAGGVWALPGTPIVGLSSQAVNNAVNLSGTGSPEGVVTAAPGSTWLQTDATTDVKGWIRWVKATGTGNTGWVAGPEADTGKRDLSAVSLSNSWVVYGGVFVLQRVGKVVYLTAYFDKSSASADAAYTLPSGFRPTGVGYVGHGQSNVADDVASVFVDPSTGVLSVTRSTVSGTYAYVTATFLTNDAWPTSLPGSAA